MPERVDSSKHRAALVAVAAGFAASLALATRGHAECAPEPQSEGRVASVVDSRTLKLADNTIVRLIGLASLRGDAERAGQTALNEIAVGRLVSVHGEDGRHDRYGRQRGWVFAEGAMPSVQEMLVAAGHGIRDTGIADRGCRSTLENAENKARDARRGLWAAAQAVKNAETSEDISTEIGHFAVLGGRVHSVRESGGWTYLNFGRRWRDGFAAMVPKGAVAAFDKAGQPLKGFEGQHVRVRGFMQKRGGPRIEITGPEQIEVVAGRSAVATVGTRD